MSETVSVIIPTYERFGLLTTRCLPSVLAQTNTDLDVHIVGDGTSDADKIENYLRGLGDPRVRFTNLPHADYPADDFEHWATIGLHSLNYGLDTAEGDYIAVCADDDALEPDAIGVLLRTLREQNVDFVYGRSHTYEDGFLSEQTYGGWPPGDAQFCNGAYVYRKNDFRYDPDCVKRGRTGDCDMWLRMVEGGVRFYYLPRFVHSYYHHP